MKKTLFIVLMAIATLVSAVLAADVNEKCMAYGYDFTWTKFAYDGTRYNMETTPVSPRVLIGIVGNDVEANWYSTNRVSGVVALTGLFDLSFDGGYDGSFNGLTFLNKVYGVKEVYFCGSFPSATHSPNHSSGNKRVNPSLIAQLNEEGSDDGNSDTETTDDGNDDADDETDDNTDDGTDDNSGDDDDDSWDDQCDDAW